MRSSEELLASWPLRNLWFAVQAVKSSDHYKETITLIIYMCPYGGILIYVSYLRATQTLLSSGFELSKGMHAGASDKFNHCWMTDAVVPLDIAARAQVRSFAKESL